MYITVKILQGKECKLEVTDSTKICDIKERVAQSLNVVPTLQRLVYKGKTLTDTACLHEYNIIDGAKIHLMVRKDGNTNATESLTPTKPTIKPDFYYDLHVYLRKHLTEEQTTKVISEFRKNYQGMINSMNFDDIERLAANNFTEF